MTRNRAIVLVLAASLSVIEIGSTFAWSNNAGSGDSRVAGTAVGHGQTSIEVALDTRPAELRSFLTGIDVNEVYGDLLAKWDQNDGAKTLTRADFNQAFAGVARLSRDDTPTNREKLRNVGWARIIAPR
jgi:hypothetical protein